MSLTMTLLENARASVEGYKMLEAREISEAVNAKHRITRAVPSLCEKRERFYREFE